MLKVKSKALSNSHFLYSVFMILGFLFCNSAYAVSNTTVLENKPDSTRKLDSFSTGGVVQSSQSSQKQIAPKSKIITGIVTDEKKEPMIGLSVSIKGFTTETITDDNGKYALQVKKGQVLIFSFLGYKSKEVEVGDSLTINVSMNEKATVLDEAVVGSEQQSTSVLIAGQPTGEVGILRKKEDFDGHLCS